MKILISGCSFTQWPDAPGGPNICWPRYFQEYNPDWQCQSVAEAAAGNQYICDSIIRGVLEDRPDRVIVMWSGVSRLDYLTSLEDDAWERLYNSYGFFRRLPNNKLGYIFSGGGTGTWNNHPVSKSMFENMYKVSSELSLGTINLMEMVKLQNFLIAKKIPYHFMSYVNYWSHEERVSPNGDFGVYQYPELQPLINELDFGRWIFLNEQRDGVYELSKQLNSWQDDGFHPGAEAQSQWAQLITDRVKQEL
jgi:hypothetical protein